MDAKLGELKIAAKQHLIHEVLHSCQSNSNDHANMLTFGRSMEPPKTLPLTVVAVRLAMPNNSIQ